ncbi:hypothetical protein PFISCL1PPCAC_2618 [Pristionchus fissidentatus]|uniref:RING-type domain-containing protein n=1 Tax=Pristionchus fissidentatus TaxID=1538716 RepID=A0AAV5UW82_9BILA|nr:hypothetical protein PFISCL1PPCAC_2618 [Pristionchus fissidentatus]
MATNLNLLGVNDICVMEKPLHKVAKSNMVTTIYLVPLSISMTTSLNIPPLSIIGREEDERLEEMTRKSEHRLMRRQVHVEMNTNLLDVQLFSGRQTGVENYAVVQFILRGDDYFIKYQSQGISDELCFSGDRNLEYHLAFGCDKQFFTLLSEKDFLTYTLMGSHKLPARDICPLCQSTSIAWRAFPCRHRYCEACVEHDIRDGTECFAGCGIGKDGKKIELWRKEAVKGYVDDGFCSYDECMERNVVNLPCQCITCIGPGEGKNCSRCEKEVKTQVPCV